MLFSLKNRITERTSQSVGLVNDMVLYEESTVTQQPVYSIARHTLGI
jgi:hypothetical protein